MEKNLNTTQVEKINTELVHTTPETFHFSDGNELMDSIELQKTYDVTPNTEFLKAQRQLGHDNFTAPKDIMDNALDPDVNATNVWVDIKQSNGEYTQIRIADDGLGITPAKINEVLKYGSKTGRDKTTYLGGYGSGLNTAAIAMGTKFEIRTKSENGPFYIIEYDYLKITETERFDAPGRIGTTEEYIDFMKTTLSKTGTIVTVSELDRMKNNDMDGYIDALARSIGKTYYYFITKYGKHFFLNGKEVNPIDPIARELPEIVPYAVNESFEYEEHKFVYSVYNIPIISLQRSKEIGRNKPSAGIYIFRNKRLVGEALDLNIVGLAADGHKSGIRIELFMDGTCDELFNLTYIKVIRELNKDQINRSFRNACKAIIGKHVSKILSDEKKGCKERLDYKSKAKNIGKKQKKQKKIQAKNIYLKMGINAYRGKIRQVDYTIKVEESISALYSKNSQGYSTALEKLIKDIAEMVTSPSTDNAGDAVVYSKSAKFSLAENTYIITRKNKIIEIKVSYCNSTTNSTFAIVRLKPTQIIDHYIILLVDMIFPEENLEVIDLEEKDPIDIIGYFYCLPAWYVEHSEDFKRVPVNGTDEANKNNKDIETRMTINKQDAFEKFGKLNQSRGTSVIDLVEYLQYLNNDDV